MIEASSISALRRAARNVLATHSLSAVEAAAVEAATEADILIAHALRRSRSWLFAHAEACPNAAELSEIERLLAARAAGIPIAQIIGKQGFWTFEVSVDDSTLIPRPETERLVELALARLPIDSSARVADLGTGTGAIAIAIALERPQVQVVATDIHEATLKVATANAIALKAGNVTLRCGSWCEALGGLHNLSMIVSNPPYIEDADPHLLQGDLRFEPRRALASGADGLDAIRRIILSAPAHLDIGGWLLLEHGFQQGHAVRALMTARGFSEISTALDLEQRERVTLGRWPVVVT